MIHSAWPTISPVKNIVVFTWNLFCFAKFWKVGTGNMCENNDPTGRVDQNANQIFLL